MGFSFWQIGIILLIVLLLFGTKKLRNIGGDLGAGIKSFKKAMNDGEKEGEKDSDTIKSEKIIADETKGRVIDNEVSEKDKA